MKRKRTRKEEESDVFHSDLSSQSDDEENEGESSPDENDEWHV